LFLLLAAQALLVTAIPSLALILGMNLTFQRYLDVTNMVSGPDAQARLLREQLIVIGVVLGSMFLLMLFFASIIANRFARPQRILHSVSSAVAEGNFEGEFPESGAFETVGTMRNLGRIARSFDRLETARRTWLVAIAEELRKPVATLNDQIRAAREVDGTISAEAFENVDDNVRRLVEITEDLQAVALADLGRLPVNFAQVDPCALIHNAIWTNKRRASLAQVTLEPGHMPATTVLVRWDGARIEQLFTALIENSLRYTPPGGRIQLGLEPSRGAWRLIIDDSAPGIDVDLAQRLFEPFYRATVLPGESVTSSGLGLATAQAIVEAHHGRIDAGSSPLGGVRVTVVLPTTTPTA
jgi:two-component system sensor histidine kinase BaeS